MEKRLNSDGLELSPVCMQPDKAIPPRRRIVVSRGLKCGASYEAAMSGFLFTDPPVVVSNSVKDRQITSGDQAGDIIRIYLLKVNPNNAPC